MPDFEVLDARTAQSSKCSDEQLVVVDQQEIGFQTDTGKSKKLTSELGSIKTTCRTKKKLSANRGKW